MAGKINKNILKNEIINANKKALSEKAFQFANQILEEEKNIYISEIQNHPVSKEIKSGPNGENISRTLDGEGNLFSFIGFDGSNDPVQEVIEEVKRKTTIKETKGSNKNLEFVYQVSTPSLEELEPVTPMPFERGNSWLKGIEKGISGFSFYLYGLAFSSSRSGGGIQSKNRVRKSNYRPTAYFSALYNRFIKRLK